METILKDEGYGFDETTSLMIIDIQDRLLPAFSEVIQNKVVRYTSVLIELASDVASKIIYSEQYPKGLGATVEQLSKHLDRATRFEKTTFDLCASPNFSTADISDAHPSLHTVVVCGMETHICVLATVRSLLKEGYRILVPIDAVASRTKANYLNGLHLMEKAGAILVNTETVVFQTMQHSKCDHFKKYSKLIL